MKKAKVEGVKKKPKKRAPVSALQCSSCDGLIDAESGKCVKCGGAQGASGDAGIPPKVAQRVEGLEDRVATIERSIISLLGGSPAQTFAEVMARAVADLAQFREMFTGPAVLELPPPEDGA